MTVSIMKIKSYFKVHLKCLCLNRLSCFSNIVLSDIIKHILQVIIVPFA